MVKSNSGLADKRLNVAKSAAVLATMIATVITATTIPTAHASELTITRLQQASRHALALAGLIERERSHLQVALAHGEAGFVACQANLDRQLATIANTGLKSLEDALKSARAGDFARAEKLAGAVAAATMRARAVVALSGTCKPKQRQRCAGTSGCTRVAVSQRGAPLFIGTRDLRPHTRRTYMPRGTRWDVMLR